jgi:hypothetical protein
MVSRRDVPAASRFRIDGLEVRCDVVEADLLDAFQSAACTYGDPQ